ncbi:MMPL family transporter [Streptomyces sp. NPDC047072]|uniref:MMPL family transporter n=1 Tax=Streptomyces sp. NPDC047072 TaxID=3154809 RepID=UPI0033E2AEA8
MATFLYRLGRFSFRKRRLVALLWVAILAACAFAAAKAPAAPDDDLVLPGTESQKAFDLLDQRFPGSSSDGAEARIVFVAPDGQKITASANKAAVEKIVNEVADGSQVKSAIDPFTTPDAVSKDGTTAYATVTYKEKSADLTDGTKNTLEDTLQDGKAAGLTVNIGGSALEPEPELGGVTEIIGLVIAAVVLVITFGSLAAAGLPLLTAIVGIAIGVASVIAIGMSSTTTTLALMLGLAVGIDYALFIVSRYRSERALGHSAEDSVGRAVGTAGSAVAFAGLTVIIALAGLSVVGIPVLTKMGLAAAGTVLVAIVLALTLLPALLGFAQNAVLPRKQRKGVELSEKDRGEKNGKPNMGTRWASFVTRRPLAVLLFSVLGLGVISIPTFSIELGMPGDESQPTSTTQRRAYDALADGFGPGFNGPLTVVIDAKGVDDPKAAAQQAAADLAKTDGVVSVSPAMFNKSGDTALLSVVPTTAPTSTETKDLIHTIRGEAPALESKTGAKMLVTSTTAVNIDMSEKLSDALLPYLAVIVGLAILLLMVVFRSVLVPLKAALGFLFSVGGAFGALVAVFQWGWLADLIGVDQTGPIVSMMPIFLIGVVFGLAMDYEVFLVTRIREAYVHGERPHQAIVTGFRHSARVVTAAAIIMIAVFAGFIGMSESFIKMIGLGLATAVFLDAFVVRMTLVPAVLALLGDRAWKLPKWLNRILPDVDIEGEKLTRTLEAVPDAGASEAEHARV